MPIRGLGELFCYDTSLRLGAFLNRGPEFIYLHRGTREGARALGLNARVQYLTSSQLPAEIRKLAPLEAEDFLCIYKTHFRKGK
jgi:hypothetical protein